MIKRTPSRNHRSKGIKIKNVLQFILLLGVCFWLIYQIKHSHDKKKEFDENDARKVPVRVQNADQILKLGRKDIRPGKDDVIQNEKQEEEDDENIVEDEGIKNEHDEQEEGSKHEKEGKQEKHEAREQEEEEEENKHGAEEQEEDENKTEEMEDDGRGGGDDEIDENDQEKSELDTDRDMEFMDAEKEKEESNEKENGNSEDEEKEGLVENQNTREAREEHYKADDASSAVAHDTQTTSTETEILSTENSDVNSEVSIMKQENKSNYTEESSTNHNDSGKITEVELMGVNVLNTTTAGKESGNTILSNQFDSLNINTTATANSDGHMEASSNHTVVITEASSNSTGDIVKTDTAGTSEQNKTVALSESEHSLNTTVDKTTGDVKSGNMENLEQSDVRVREDNLPNINSTISVKTGNGDAAAGESSNTRTGEIEKTMGYAATNETQNDSRNSDTKENTDTSVDEKRKGNTEVVETNVTQNTSAAKENNDINAFSVDERSKGNTESSETNGTQNSSDAKEKNNTTEDEKSKDDTQTGETDEISDSSSVNGGTSDAVEQEAIDASDTHVHKDVTAVRADLDTLPDIRNEGNVGDGDETAAE